METLTIAIEGMTCGHCVRQVDSALKRLEGVEVQAVRVGEATVTYDRTSISVQEIAQAIHEVGYQVQPVGRAA
jgi:copper ion binding protein